MRTEQTLEWLKKGYNNTLFLNSQDLVKNLSKCFGNGKITMVRVDKEEHKITIRITNSTHTTERYDRKFIITYTDSKKRIYNHPYKITDIIEIL